MYTEITVMSYTYLHQTVGLAIQIKFDGSRQFWSLGIIRYC